MWIYSKYFFLFTFKCAKSLLSKVELIYPRQLPSRRFKLSDDGRAATPGAVLSDGKYCE